MSRIGKVVEWERAVKPFGSIVDIRFPIWGVRKRP